MANHSFSRWVILQWLAILVLLIGQATCFAEDLLTPEQRAWLKAHPDIRVAVLPDYPPISYLDVHGQPIGLEQDYLKLIESRLGIHFKNVIPTLFQRAAISPAEKQADVIAIFAITEERLQHWNFTQPYLDFPVYLITQEDAPIGFSLDDAKQKRISAVGHYATQGYLKEHHPNVEIDAVDDTCIGLQHVSFGASAGMLSDLPVANWCADHFGIKNLKIANITQFHYRMGLAVRKDWPVLLAILEKGLSTITQSERDEIYQRWNKNALDKSFLEIYRDWIFAGVFVLLSVLIYRLIQWDRKLKTALDNRLSDQQSIQVPTVSQKAMNSNVITFIVIIAIIFGSLAFTYEYYDKANNLVIALIQIVLISTGLLSGFVLGSMQRRFEVDDYLNQLLNQTNKREAFERKLSLSEQRLLKQQQALSLLTQHQLKAWQNPEEIFREITQVSAETLGIERVSVWLFSDNKAQLDCMSLYLQSKNLHTIAKPLQAHDFPHYFNHLAQSRVIAANDAQHHAATAEFVEPYLRENNITAMLDGTIWLNNEVIGVICHEHVAGIREWTLDEQNFVGSIADLARLTIETHRRRQAEQTLLRYSEELEVMVEARSLSLQESEQRFSYVVEHAPISILIISNEGKIVEFNPEAEIDTGYRREQAIGKDFIKLLVAKESRRQTLALAARALKGEDLRDVELLLERADGRKTEFLCSVSVAANSAGNRPGQMVAIGQDISQQKALQLSLIKAREAAESADRIKSMFVASMSHELRTPLNSIIGFLGIVLHGMSGELNATQKDQLGRAYHSAKHLLSLISDVIDISKIEAGFLQVYVERFELNPLLIEIGQAIQHLAKGKDLVVTIICAPDLIVETDRKRLYQVVLNVVSNAIKYTEEGSVEVTAYVEDEQLVIITKDTGIGIAEENLAKLFEPFERIDSRLKIKTLGTGLGLYLTRKILTQLLGGAINVTSKPEEGSVFTITIPTKLTAIIPPSTASVLEEPSS